MNEYETHQLSLERLTPKQCLNIRGPIMDMDNRINEIFPLFDLFNKKFSPGDRLIDVFPSCFSFHSTNRQSEESIKMHICNLNNITLQASADPKSAIVVSDASIKNQVATSISHIHVHDRQIIKTVHHAINIMSTEAEIFAIRCNINQATNCPILGESSSSLTPSMLQKEYLTHRHTHFKFMCH